MSGYKKRLRVMWTGQDHSKEWRHKKKSEKRRERMKFFSKERGMNEIRNVVGSSIKKYDIEKGDRAKQMSHERNWNIYEKGEKSNSKIAIRSYSTFLSAYFRCLTTF